VPFNLVDQKKALTEHFPNTKN